MIKSKRTVLFLIVTGLYWFSLYTYVPILATFAESKGASHGFAGIIIGSYGLAQMLLRIPLGILSDRINRRKLFVILGIFLGFTSSLGMWLFHSPPMLLIFRSIAGTAAAAWVVFTVLFSNYFEPEKVPSVLGYILAVTTIGQSTAIFAGGVASDMLGSTSPFLIGAMVGLAGLMLSFRIIEKRQEETKQSNIGQLVGVIREPGLILFSVLAIFVQFMTFATVYGFTPVAAKSIGASDFQLGLLTTLSTLPAALGSVMSGSFFSRRLGEKATILCGFAITIASCAMIPLIDAMPLLYVTQIIGGFSRGVVLPLLMGLSIKQVENQRRASAMGFFQAIYGLGMFLGPSLTGLLSDTVGIQWGFLATAMVGLAGFIITLFRVNTSNAVR